MTGFCVIVTVMDIAVGRHTDAVDELLIKFVNAKTKKFKVVYTT